MLISPVLHRLDLFSDLMLAIGLVFGKSQETKFLYNSLLTPVSSLNPGLPARSCHQKASVLILCLLLTKHIKHVSNQDLHLPYLEKWKFGNGYL